jgi:hypothetical protein
MLTCSPAGTESGYRHNSRASNLESEELRACDLGLEQVEHHRDDVDDRTRGTEGQPNALVTVTIDSPPWLGDLHMESGTNEERGDTDRVAELE